MSLRPLRVAKLTVLGLGALVLGVGCATTGSRATGFFAGHGDGQRSGALGVEQRLMATRADTGGHFDVLEGIWAPQAVFAMHRHGFDEIYYVADGEIVVDYGDRQVRAETGAFFYFPEGQTHSLTNPSTSKPLKLIILFAPSFGDGYDVILDRLDAMAVDDPQYGAKVAELMENVGATVFIEQ